ncbi:MAG: 30S ribosomal protein S17 [Proteobacteria bacterium]|nr:30S ribosomal protein S17 [Pseudomonadota bacterium]
MGEKSNKRSLLGVVVSDKMEKTIVVSVERRVRHPRYNKQVRRSARYKAHDENNTAKIGDKVNIEESRPLSKDKKWILKDVVGKAV